LPAERISQRRLLSSSFFTRSSRVVRLPLTEQALRDGILDYSRTRLIASLTANPFLHLGG